MCPSELDRIKATLPDDGRFRYANYGKGVLIWGVLGYSGHDDSTGACFMNPAHHALRDTDACLQPMQTMIRGVNQQIHQLASVLDSPFADGYATAPSGVRVMAKKHDATYYVFAASSQTLARACASRETGSAAEVLGEGYTVPITDGAITDTFADGNAVHIYRITG